MTGTRAAANHLVFLGNKRKPRIPTRITLIIGHSAEARGTRLPTLLPLLLSRLVTSRYDSVFHGPGGLEAGGLGGLDQLDGADRVDIAAGVAVADAKFHGGLRVFPQLTMRRSGGWFRISGMPLGMP